ncbi:MAG: hypothetical protein KGV50_01530 [Gammaproteobacteria bacterium]|nr:hypothetical protein [Gammaproteobacteria bacterium]
MSNNHKPTNTDSKQHFFGCKSCGSALEYHISTQELSCQSCGHSEKIKKSHKTIKEFSLKNALENITLKPFEPPSTNISCNNCGATSQWDDYTLSDACQYCKTPIAQSDTNAERIHIEAIVPFILERTKAQNIYGQWIKKRWFAPNTLKQMSGHNKTFERVYIPHWTFDSSTDSNYQGLRGDYYIDFVTSTKIVNGKLETVTMPVQKTRWTSVSGTVRIFFDDLIVLASMLIPTTIVQELGPWRLQDAKPYTPEYITGSKTHYYQLNLDDAYSLAQENMQRRINVEIKREIGGDKQRIRHIDTNYQNSTYKLVMLPIWHSSFEYRGKIYKTVINGQSGKIAGQYPKSTIKITIAATAAALLIGAVVYFVWQLPSY